jgi:hypothetical protein
MKTPLTFAKLAGALLVTLTIAFSSREAHALGPIGIEVGAQVGYGASPGGAPVNPLGVGLGGRAGITFFNIYAGAKIMDYIGSGDTFGGQYHALQYGGEIGYGFSISVLTIRPQIGVGNISLSGAAVGPDGQPVLPTGSSLYLEPGAVALITIGIVYFGADASALMITSEPAYGGPGNFQITTNFQTGFTAHGQLGISF